MPDFDNFRRNYYQEIKQSKIINLSPHVINASTLPDLHYYLSAPYKRWSKCTMEKVGEGFFQGLRGSA